MIVEYDGQPSVCLIVLKAVTRFGIDALITE
jgi:hypothetical protein